jgi:hypothetical protein
MLFSSTWQEMRKKSHNVFTRYLLVKLHKNEGGFYPTYVRRPVSLHVCAF